MSGGGSVGGAATTVDEFSIDDGDVIVLELAVAGATVVVVVVVVAITIGFDSTTRVLGSDAVVTTLCKL